MHPGTTKSSTPVLPDSDGHVRAFWLLVKSCVGAEVVPPYHFWLRAHPLLDINVLAMTRQGSVVLRCIYAEGVDLATLTSEQRAVPGPCSAEGAQGCCNSRAAAPRPGSGNAESIFGRTAQPNTAGSSEKTRLLIVSFCVSEGLGDTGAQQARIMAVVCTNPRGRRKVQPLDHLSRAPKGSCCGEVR